VKSQLLGGVDRERRFAVVLESNEEIKASLRSFADLLRSTGHITGIGAVRDATIAYWDSRTRAYQNIHIHEQAEVLSLTGNIAQTRDAIELHAHVVLGMSDGRAMGGHLVDAVVHPTLELLFIESAWTLRRERDSGTGLQLLAFSADAAARSTPP
jgi:uncharacterized protein